MQIKETIKQIFIKRENRLYQKELAMKKPSYEKWVKQDEAKKHVTSSRQAEGFVIWKLAGGSLSQEAIPQLNAYFQAHPETLILYGDEDVEEKGIRSNPWVKPCWSPDTYLSFFYVGSVLAVKKSLLKEAQVSVTGDVVEYTQTEQIRELMDHLFTLAGAFEKGTKTVARVPYVLYHASQKEMWETHFASFSGMLQKDVPLKLSVIIPSKDNPEILKQCLDSLQKQRAELEIIVVDNGSSTSNREKIEKLAALTKDMQYLYEPMEFNFSAMCNLGARHASNDLLLFLNDDIELCENDGLRRMCQKVVLPYVGAVGLKLYYPGGNLIQHAGVVNLPIGPDHKLRTLPDDKDYYFGWNRYTHDCIAATAACVVIEADKFWEAGGFSTELAVCYNDVDLCFRLYELGYQNVVVNEAFAYHHESLSRGTDEKPEKLARFKREWEKLYERHPALKNEDPYFPRELDKWIQNTQIKPAYVYGVLKAQEPLWKQYTDMGQIRYDECLMARVEICNEEKIQGYGIVLGDDNACYKRYVVLCPDLTAASITPDSMIMQAENQYRYELEENVPDQKNVALCGFCIDRTGETPAHGSYKAGMLAVNRVTGLKLFNWCGKVVKL